jgi:exopolysaccharide biosynthesis polyprenyl glycosylphosphotransferase
VRAPGATGSQTGDQPAVTAIAVESVDVAPDDPATRGAEVRDERRRFVRSRFARNHRRPVDIRDIREGSRNPAILRRDARIRRSLAVADALAAALSVTLAAALSGHGPSPALLAGPVLFIVLCKLGRLYDRDEHVVRKGTLDQAPALLQATTVFSFAIWLASDAFVPGGFDKPEVAAVWATLLVSVSIFRFASRRIALRTTAPERLLLLGSAQAASRLAARLERAHSVRAMLVGRVALERGDRAAPVPIGPLDDLDYLLRHHEVERVIIAPHALTSDEQLDTIRLVKSLGVKVSVLPRLFEVVGSSMEFDDVDGITLLGLRRYGLSKTSWYLKHTFDVVAASLGLVVLSPLLLVIAVAIRLSSSGPVLFKQTRVGRRGERFQMLKFRTMYDGADGDKDKLLTYCDGDGLFKLHDDPRVTPVGRLLRRASLDELPQLVNVLRGEMSLVGPRPLIEEEDEKIAGWHHRRREGTPGMTGVWQVLGSARVPLDDMVKMDYLYRANWSLWLDVKILLRTFAHVCGRRGA